MSPTMKSRRSLGPMARFSSVCSSPSTCRSSSSVALMVPSPAPGAPRRRSALLWRNGRPAWTFGCGRVRGSDVDALPVECVRRVDDEVLARADVAAHEQLEHPGGGVEVGSGDLAQGAVARVHGGLGELVGIHLAQALVALQRLGLLAALGQ